MKDRISDANFPRTDEGRVYHLGLKAGEVANRIITVGSASRAQGIATFFDATPKPFILASERGFLTITGRYRNVPISVVSIGMGSPNADFFIREVRECLSGDMIVIRLGSCGCLADDISVGSVVIPKASVAVTRNYDFDFTTGDSQEHPYRISRQVDADPTLHRAVENALRAHCPTAESTKIIANKINASADSFYSSQGRQTSFPDHNAGLIDQLTTAFGHELATLEMETFHILHLAASWHGNTTPTQSTPPPLTTTPVLPTMSESPSKQALITEVSLSDKAQARKPRIIAAAAQMVFASRTSQDFITPDGVIETERWTGQGVLEALRTFKVDSDHLHSEFGSVWEL